MFCICCLGMVVIKSFFSSVTLYINRYGERERVGKVIDD